MPTFTEVLPPSKSNPHRAMKYTPACMGVGVLELTDKRSHTRYAVAVQPFGGVRLTKAGGSETYVVSLAACECKGFVFGKAGVPCKHIEAVTALVSNNWLDGDDRETVSDRHADAEEKDAYYADAFENHDGPDRMSDDAYADALGRRLVREPLPC